MTVFFHHRSAASGIHYDRIKVVARKDVDVYFCQISRDIKITIMCLQLTASYLIYLKDHFASVMEQHFYRVIIHSGK